MAEVFNYINAKNRLMEEFNCKEDYFVKILEDCKWFANNKEGFYKLSYLDKVKDREVKKDAVIVEVNNKPQIFRTEKYTMVVAIQCVKIAFIFKNINEVNREG